MYIIAKQADPFRSLDDAAVGTLLSSGLQKCHDAKSNMECTILDGDHTSDPRYYTAVLYAVLYVQCCTVYSPFPLELPFPIQYQYSTSILHSYYTCCTYCRSIDFFSEYGAQTLCCPVKRVPIARIAAAQTAIKASNKGKFI